MAELLQILKYSFKKLDIPLGLRCILGVNGAKRFCNIAGNNKRIFEKKGKNMTIKEVEKLTGLTAKSIRYYESKDLIAVKRNQENSYRSYSEKDITRLKRIKLFRYLDFSIEEIRLLLDGEEEQVKEALRNKAENFADKKNICEDKQEMCLSLAKDYKTDSQIIEEYNEAIELLESDEMSELMEELKDAGCPSIPVAISTTVVCFAPIFWLFYNIGKGRNDMLPANAVLALFATAFLTASWIHYVTQYRRHKKRIKKKNREWVGMMPVIIIGLIISCILGLAAIVAVTAWIEKLMAPENYLFFEYQPVASVVMIWLIMIPTILACLLILTKLFKKNTEQLENMNDIVFIWNHLGKGRAVAIIIWVIGLYCCITSVNFVTEDTIICHSPIHPAGIIYQYSDIEQITTGFGNKSFAIAEYKKKGNFYYQITLDGKKITFHVPSVNENIGHYQEDSYLELEEFDQKLVNLKIPKTSDKKGYENCDYDQQYVDRFLRIISR